MRGKFKSRVALEALRGAQTIAEIAGRYQIHPNLVMQWKKRLQESASEVFLTKAERKAEQKPYTEDDLMKKKSAGLRWRLIFYDKCPWLAA